MLIGYVRVSQSDGSQTLARQRDALLAAGVAPERIYQDLASPVGTMRVRASPPASRRCSPATRSCCGSWTGWGAT